MNQKASILAEMARLLAMLHGEIESALLIATAPNNLPSASPAPHTDRHEQP